MSLVRMTGALSALAPEDRALLVERSFSNDPHVSATVQQVLREVRAKGDETLRALAKQYDSVELQTLEVPRAQWQRALAGLDPTVRRGLERAARNLEAVSRASVPPESELTVEPGVIVGRRADPLARVGVYAPGGKAAYPSSVLMGAVPARAVGVREVILCSPPGPTGMPSDVVLAAAELAGLSRVFAVGGAGAIAALAYGTQSIPRVDRIVGPGNAWVAEAKRQVAGEVGIDSPAGPSEILVIADAEADATLIARELLAQAEHDVDACCVALVTSVALAGAVAGELERLLPLEERRATIEVALRKRGAVLSVGSLAEAVAFSNEFAPEHLQLAVRATAELLPLMRNAGTIFVGAAASVAFGDYVTGGNHVLPTAGAARRFSGLSALDFVRWTTWQRVSPAAAAAFSTDVFAMAMSEGLPAHAKAAQSFAGATGAPDDGLRRRPTLALIERYVPTRPPCEIDLTDNTNLFGMPEGLARAMKDLPPSRVTRYPSPYAEALRAALALEAQVGAESIITGCGSDDLLDATMRAFAEPGEVLASCPPTFGIVPSFGQANGLVHRAVALDVDALAASNARVIYLCSPNNPTGGVLPVGFVEKLLGRTRALIVLDEAYGEFSSAPSLMSLAARTPRLLVVKTLSKAFGLAGLRLGWAVGAPSTIGELEKTRGPYKVGGVAEQAALVMLGQERAWVRDCVAKTKSLRERLTTELRARGLSPLKSEANFVLVPITGKADAAATRLREHGVSVRAFSGLPGIGEALRITIGPWPMLEACVNALSEVLR
jgi:histidinol dehydrogenase